MTVLARPTPATLHQEHGHVVMEDSRQELTKHLPIMIRAHGRVLVSGLGLGCVVRGLLANPRVRRIDVVEIDRHIVRVIGPEFAGNPRVRIWLGDALTKEWRTGTRFDYAWHDVWTEEGNGAPLHELHVRLIARYRRHVRVRQGAWAMPRPIKRAFAGEIIG